MHIKDIDLNLLRLFDAVYRTGNVSDIAAGFSFYDCKDGGTIFIGMDQFSEELAGSSVKGKNPFKDVRVRQAAEPCLTSTVPAACLPEAVYCWLPPW